MHALRPNGVEFVFDSGQFGAKFIDREIQALGCNFVIVGHMQDVVTLKIAARGHAPILDGNGRIITEQFLEFINRPNEE